MSLAEFRKPYNPCVNERQCRAARTGGGNDERLLRPCFGVVSGLFRSLLSPLQSLLYCLCDRLAASRTEPHTEDSKAALAVVLLQHLRFLGLSVSIVAAYPPASLFVITPRALAVLKGRERARLAFFLNRFRHWLSHFLRRLNQG